VLACSALKRKYREQLRVDGVQFVYLQGSRELIRERLHSRRGHFASDSILEGQFADLEPPKKAITVDVSKSPQAIVDEIIGQLKT
jgi:carbohydrate kinase (thermoresistant glucokinase family)